MVLALYNEMMIPEDAPVRLTSAQLEEPDYREPYRAYSSKGWKSAADGSIVLRILSRRLIPTLFFL